jgi:hypothetical protein
MSLKLIFLNSFFLWDICLNHACLLIKAGIGLITPMALIFTNKFESCTPIRIINLLQITLRYKSMMPQQFSAVVSAE